MKTRIEPTPSANRAQSRVWAALDHSDRIFSLFVTEDVEDGIARDRANRWFTGLQRGQTVIELVLLPGQDPRCGDAVHIDHDWLGHLLDGRLCTGQGVPLAAAEGATLTEQRIEAQERATALRQTVCLVATGQAFWPASERDTETEDDWTDGADPSRVPAPALALGLLAIAGLLVLVGWML